MQKRKKKKKKKKKDENGEHEVSSSCALVADRCKSYRKAANGEKRTKDAPDRPDNTGEMVTQNVGFHSGAQKANINAGEQTQSRYDDDGDDDDDAWGGMSMEPREGRDIIWNE